MQYFFTEDKSEYNKFMFRLRQAPTNLQEEWESIRDKDNQETIIEFAKDIMAMKKGVLPEEVLKKYTRVEKSEEDGTEGEWSTYKQAEETYDDDDDDDDH